MKHFKLSILWVALLFATGSQGQGLELDFWDLGTQPYEMGLCAREGMNIELLPGFPPELDDPWVYLFGTCKTFGGSVGCQKEEVNSDGVNMGQCLCNQLDDQEWDWDLQTCVGKVDAICTAEYTSFIPEKRCGENATCIADQGEGYSVGTCQCLGGYIENEERKCGPDPRVGDGDRATPRTTTTTEAPDRGELQLPLSLLFQMNFNVYDEDCQSKALLNRTYCSTHQSTVACIDRKCQCNMRGDSTFDEELGLCIGLHGTYCLARSNLMGWKACTDGADCYVEEGTSVDKYSFGTCQCMYGYKNETDGTCTRDSSIPNPSTRRSGGFPTPPAEAPEPTTPPYKDSVGSTKGSGILLSLVTLLYITFAIYSR